MDVIVMGALGNMGRRYQAILRHLGHIPLIIDINEETKSLKTLVDRWIDDISKTRFAIIATPTLAHTESLETLLSHSNKGMHILCEKPLATDPAIVKHMFDMAENHGSSLYCVNQYAFLQESRFFFMSRGVSTYNYFNHGKDGLHWDCFQLHALASDQLVLGDTSPTWRCSINSVPISIAGMDQAYVDMLRNFLGPRLKMWQRSLVTETSEKIAHICAK